MEPDADALTRAWAAAQDRLPDTWRLDGLRCASTGLAPDQRSADWIAVAIGPGGQERSFRAPDPFAALDGLATELASA
jgi:hypothetical protein